MPNKKPSTKAKGTFVPARSPLIGKRFSILNHFGLKLTWLKTTSIFQAEDNEKNYLNPQAKFEPGIKFGVKGPQSNIARFCEQFNLP